MAFPLNVSDPYVRRARLQPGLLVVLPLALAVLAYFPNGLAGWGVLWSLIVTCGGTALLAQVARDRGKRKQEELFELWGGKPTTRLLRHRGAPNKVILQRRHTVLTSVLQGIAFPSPDEEAADPESADNIYDACVTVLLEKTRDKARFPLVFEENCNYGFRRNLWGMKPIGIFTSGVTTIALAVAGILHVVTIEPQFFLSLALSGILFLGWAFWFTPDWVRKAADSYAERLLAACESL